MLAALGRAIPDRNDLLQKPYGSRPVIGIQTGKFPTVGMSGLLRRAEN